MAFVYVIICCVIGIAVGGTVGNDATAAFGFFAGIAFGLVFARLRTLSMRIAALEREPAVAPSPAVQRPDAVTPGEISLPPIETNEPATPPEPTSRPATPSPAPIIDSAARRAAMASAATPATSADTTPPPRVATPRVPPQPGAIDNAVAAIKRWFTEGNVPVKIGMLVLIAGIAALLKYATDQGWLHVPVELRLAGVAAAAIAALAFGWRQRERKRSFALSVQGGAIGVLLMTVFAAFRLYQLLPASAAFGLLLVLVAGTGVLAVLQDALALAVLGLIAGFAAPILISTGEGNHVVLFSYYALLNLAIFAIAWKKAWRTLNLLGFFFTYAIGTLWGVLKYTPALRDTTEPFLVVFFAIYLAIPVIYARRAGEAKRDLVDGTLVFGNPLIAFALQAALLDGDRMPLAYSALALAAIYALLAFALLRRAGFRMLAESFAVLAVGFATLAIPLALSARSTACTFALEGAALVWLGFRQQRRLPRWTGLALQLLAAGAFAISVSVDASSADTIAIANGGFLGASLIAASAFVTAWLYATKAANTRLATLLYGWGLLWWIGAGLREIDRFVPHTRMTEATLAFVSLTLLLAAVAWNRTKRSAPAWTAAVGLALGIAFAFLYAADDVRPYLGWGLAAYAAYAAAGFIALRFLADARDSVLTLAHGGWLWAWIAAFALALRQVATDAGLAEGWCDALTVLPLLVAWMLALLRPNAIAMPLASRFAAWRPLVTGSQALVASVAFALLLLQPGESAPLPFVPIVNPVELVQLAILACLARWLADAGAPPDLAKRRLALLVAAGLVFVTAATLRAVHHLASVPWNAEIGSSMVAQTSLTVVWSVLGVVGWVMGSKRGSRPLWLAGAVLMGIVLAKLLLIDRTHLGSAFGIASFIAYGLLCTVIGYFAPAPPREARALPAGDSA